MKRLLLLLLVIAGAAAFAIWLGLRGSARLSSTTVTALLPRETAAFLHVPDLNKARNDWHETELYKLWREPQVQEFLRKPMARNPRSTQTLGKLQELAQLEIRDAFIAAVAWEKGDPTMISGFRYNGKPLEVEKVIGPWRAHAMQDAGNGKGETVTYEGHQIEIVQADKISLATVYDGDWFFAANDLPALKALLDRADGRAKDAGATLTGEENFAAAFRHMPRDYAALIYARLDRYLAKIDAGLPANEADRPQRRLLREIKSIAAATGFRDGNIRDVLFVARPRSQEHGDLTRSSLALTTAQTFFYSASFVNFPEGGAGDQGPGLPPVLGRFLNAFAANGATAQDWKTAFGTELGIVGDWPENARMPAFYAILPVLDAGRAQQLIASATASANAGGEEAWTASEKNGVQYYAQAPANPMVPVAPTIGLSPQRLVVGLDLESVEAALKRATAGTTALTSASSYQAAERMVLTPKSAFAYLDTALFYTRLDAALRPMLIMAAAFVPAVAEAVDLSKLPPSEIITQHLGPVALSQYYDGDGYITESIGPISLYQAAIGLAVATGAGQRLYQQQAAPRTSASPAAIVPPAIPSPSAPSPATTP